MFQKIFKSQQAYFDWRIKKVKRIAKRFPKMFNVWGKKVLDIGCGAEAPLSFYLTKKGAIVWGGDVTKEIVSSAKKFAKKAKISIFSSENLPFEDNKFDFVFMMDVLEHVKDPEKAIKEIIRVTKDNGMIFIEYSPYYAYPTGHHLYTLGIPRGLVPYQFIPRTWTKFIVLHSKLKTKDTPKFLFSQFDNLNKINIIKVDKILKNNNIKKIDERYCISLPNSEIEINFLKYLPFIKELLTMSYSFILKK